MESPLIYKIILPSGIDEGKKYPVIYVMHGIGSNEEDILSVVEELKDDFILISVRGMFQHEDGFSHYSIQGFGNPRREVFDESVERIESFIEYAVDTYPIDLHHQYLLGFSQGAVLSMTLALTLGNKIKGIIALSGYIPQFVKEEYTIKPIDDVSIYISHGVYDAIFPLQDGKESEEFFRKRSRNVRFVSYLMGHQITHQNQKDFINWIYQDLNASK